MRAQSEVAPAPPPPLSLSRFSVEDFHINVKETAGRYQFGVEVRRVSLQVEGFLEEVPFQGSLSEQMEFGIWN